MANIYYRQTATPGIPQAVIQDSAIKGSPLTNAEGDYNLWTLNEELQTKASATNPVFNDIVRMNDLYLAGGRIKKYAIGYSGIIPSAGFLIGDYVRGNDGEKAIFDISVKLQKQNTTTLEGRGKIYFQATTGVSISVFHWTSHESNEAPQSLKFEVWAKQNGDIRIFCVPTGSAEYDHVAYEIMLLESGDFTKFTPSRSLTSKVVTGYTEVVNATQRLVSSGKVDIKQSGSYEFVGDSRKITGDFSNTDHTKRVLISTSTADSGTSVGILPNGTGTSSGVISYSSSDVANSSYAAVSADASNVTIESGKFGSGTYKPMSIRLSGSEKISIDLNGVPDFKGDQGSASYYGAVKLGGREIRKVIADNRIEFVSDDGSTVTHSFGNTGSFSGGASTLSSLTLGSALPVTQGGTGATLASQALTNLGGSTVGKTIFGVTDLVALRSYIQSPIFENTPRTPAFFQSTTIESGFYTNDGTGLLNAAGTATAIAGYWHVLVFYHDVNGYAAQLAIELSAGNANRMYLRVAEGTSWGDWSSIGGQRVVNGGSSSAAPLYAQVNDCCIMWAGNNVFLPSNPVPGDKVVIYKHGAQQCTVMRNGQNIMSLSENCGIDYNNSTLTFTYMDSGIGWTIS